MNSLFLIRKCPKSHPVKNGLQKCTLFSWNRFIFRYKFKYEFYSEIVWLYKRNIPLNSDLNEFPNFVYKIAQNSNPGKTDFKKCMSLNLNKILIYTEIIKKFY